MRGMISVPKAYTEWVLVEGCATAVKMFQLQESDDDDGMDTLVKSDPADWIKYKGKPLVEILERQGDCAHVRLVRTRQTGWISSALILTGAAQKAEQDRLEAAQKAEQDRRAAGLKAEQEEKAKKQTEEAAERARVRAICATVYHDTIDTKLKDLTVREDQQVRACQALDLYRPR